MPDVVSAVIRMRDAYVNFLRRIGSATAANQLQTRTTGILEMLAHSPEAPDSQRFVFTATNGATFAYRQIVVNRSQPGPTTLITILHGRQARGSDNFQQLTTPALFPLLEYV